MLERVASKAQYIAAYLLSSFASSVSILILAQLAFAGKPITSEELISWLFVSYLAITVCWNAVYSFFPQLNPSKFLKWVVPLGLLGAVINIGHVVEIYRDPSSRIYGSPSEPIAVIFVCCFFYIGVFSAVSIDRYKRFCKEGANRSEFVKKDVDTFIPEKETNNFHNNPNYSDFKKAVEFFPQLQKNLEKLSVLGSLTQNTFIDKIINEKLYAEADEVASNLIMQALERRLGSDKKILEFGYSLLREANATSLHSLEEYIRIFGNTVSPDEIIAKVKQDHEVRLFVAKTSRIAHIYFSESNGEPYWIIVTKNQEHFAITKAEVRPFQSARDVRTYYSDRLQWREVSTFDEATRQKVINRLPYEMLIEKL